MAHTPFVFNDGGRAAAGLRGSAGDCVARALAIAMQRPYAEVYADMAAGSAQERRTKHGGRIAGRRSARNGVHTSRAWFRRYLESHGWRWVPCMSIGSGCRVHLVADELPMGRLIVAVSKHLTAVIDGQVHDTYDPQRTIFPPDGGAPTERCVYGYWIRKEA
jgi:hypothetical protein